VTIVTFLGFPQANQYCMLAATANVTTDVEVMTTVAVDASTITLFPTVTTVDCG